MGRYRRDDFFKFYGAFLGVLDESDECDCYYYCPWQITDLQHIRIFA